MIIVRQTFVSFVLVIVILSPVCADGTDTLNLILEWKSIIFPERNFQPKSPIFIEPFSAQLFVQNVCRLTCIIIFILSLPTLVKRQPAHTICNLRQLALIFLCETTVAARFATTGLIKINNLRGGKLQITWIKAVPFDVH